MTSTNKAGTRLREESISSAVMNASGKIVMECVLETKASTILQFMSGLRGGQRMVRRAPRDNGLDKTRLNERKLPPGYLETRAGQILHSD
jgi:hypothetical protein